LRRHSIFRVTSSSAAPSFECQQCGELLDITYGRLNTSYWEHKGQPIFCDASPTAQERRGRYAGILMKVGELADKRKRAREAQRC
jgi:hypothetical protein